MWWNPKSLNPYVTNLELLMLFVAGFLLGKYAGLVVFAVLIFGVPPAVYWWRGYCGLDQMPNPYGRYYRRWLTLAGVGDYYRWLAREMGDRQPWREWAQSEEELMS